MFVEVHIFWNIHFGPKFVEPRIVLAPILFRAQNVLDPKVFGVRVVLVQTDWQNITNEKISFFPQTTKGQFKARLTNSYENRFSGYQETNWEGWKKAFYITQGNLQFRNVLLIKCKTDWVNLQPGPCQARLGKTNDGADMEKSADPKSKGSDGPWSSVYQSKDIENYVKYREEGDGS